MRIYLDLDTRRILLSPTRPATRLEFKRRDNDAFEVQFLRAGAVQSLPVGTIARVGVKATEDFAGEFLATDTLSVTGTGADTVYRGAFNLNTTALEALFPTEPASITAMLEVQWMSGTSVGSSLTLPITIFNDVIRGDEGAPADLPLFYTSETSNFLATQAEAEAGSDNTKWMSPLRVAQAIEELGGSGGVSSWNDLTDKPSTFPPSTHTHPLSALTDIPSTFPPSTHTHAAADITSGTLALALIPTGTTSSTVALGDHTHTFGSTTGTFCQGNDSRLLTITGGITAIAVVATMPASPSATTLYIVTA